MKSLRNQAVFHQDNKVFEKGVALYPESLAVFLRSDGETPDSYYYELADIAVLRFVLDSSDEASVFQSKTIAMMQEVTEIARRFSYASDDLVTETLAELGWKLEHFGAG